MEENEPPAASLPTLEDVYAAAHGGAPPSPDDSTLDDVAQTVIEAQAVAGAFRRHGVAAAPALALRCEGVASALDAAIAEHFGDVLKD